MAMVEHLIYFLIASTLMLAAWFGFMFLNNLLDRMKHSPLQEILGTACAFALFLAVGVILYFFGLSVCVGALCVFVVWLVYYLARKAVVTVLSAVGS